MGIMTDCSQYPLVDAAVAVDDENSGPPYIMGLCRDYMGLDWVIWVGYCPHSLTVG